MVLVCVLVSVRVDGRWIIDIRWIVHTGVGRYELRETNKLCWSLDTITGYIIIHKYICYNFKIQKFES